MAVTTAVVGLILYLIGWASPVLAPLGLGLFLTALAAPFFGWLVRRGRSPSVAMLVTVGLVALIGGAIVLLALVSVRQLGDSLGTYTDELRARYPELADSLASIGLSGGLLNLISPEALTAVLRAVVEIVASVGSSLAFAIVIAALLLLDGPRLAGLVASGLGGSNPVFRETPALARAAVTYFTVRIKINAVTAAGLLVLMLLLGVDDALLWAVGAFVLSFVPYIGLVIALIPPTILAFAESGLGAAAAIVIAGTILNVVAENVLEPSLTGRALKLSTWLVFAMFFFWVWLIGPVGALLSMPITVLIVLVLQRNERTHWIATLLSRG